MEGRREGEEKAEDYMLGGVEGMVHLLGLRGIGSFGGVEGTEVPLLLWMVQRFTCWG